MAASIVCVPGQRLSRADDTHVAGEGTYVRGGFIYSSLVGWLNELKTEEQKVTLTVQTEDSCTVIPTIDAVVTARVTNVNPRFCKCAILSVGTSPLRDVFRGMIRKEDVRATEKDRVEMHKCYRPGDIITARVLSLGDAQSYLLTTAENELGVAMATSEAGVNMVPVSWCKMQCPKTLNEEFRKVAKVQPEYIEYVRS
ncbi:exosome complex component CSL4 isoform X2 [Aplysia californica]|uniref:Exosome complex component CSL4 isoform X2 n=1 Tax=Aplysia californica TaxID=6500 RepID=A0ABM0JZK3_APLCA|nr:exosome complex component CSL4 isoform X2 [Aplysia californica]